MQKLTKIFPVLIILGLTFTSIVKAEPTEQEKKFYRELNLSLRKSAKFFIPMPGLQKTDFSYNLEFDQPLWQEPIIGDMPSDGGDPTRKGQFYRSFFDKIFLKDGSVIKLNGEEIPLTCVFINGQDNRFSGNPSPVFPQFIMKVYLVANSFSCQGPIRPGWPETGGKKEAWDTYIYFEIRDPTIMLPSENKLRYRWNEYEAILVDDGGGR